VNPAPSVCHESTVIGLDSQQREAEYGENSNCIRLIRQICMLAFSLRSKKPFQCLDTNSKTSIF